MVTRWQYIWNRHPLRQATFCALGPVKYQNLPVVLGFSGLPATPLHGSTACYFHLNTQRTRRPSIIYAITWFQITFCLLRCLFLMALVYVGHGLGKVKTHP